MNQFRGTIDQLKAAVAAYSLIGEWTERPQNGLHCFRAGTGEILNWWPSRGTLQVQGKNSDAFESALAIALGKTSAAPQTADDPTAKIFVVHGHDREAAISSNSCYIGSG